MWKQPIKNMQIAYRWFIIIIIDNNNNNNNNNIS